MAETVYVIERMEEARGGSEVEKSPGAGSFSRNCGSLDVSFPLGNLELDTVYLRLNDALLMINPRCETRDAR